MMKPATKATVAAALRNAGEEPSDHYWTAGKKQWTRGYTLKENRPMATVAVLPKAETAADYVHLLDHYAEILAPLFDVERGEQVLWVRMKSTASVADRNLCNSGSEGEQANG